MARAKLTTRLAIASSHFALDRSGGTKPGTVRSATVPAQSIAALSPRWNDVASSRIAARLAVRHAGQAPRPAVLASYCASAADSHVVSSNAAPLSPAEAAFRWQVTTDLTRPPTALATTPAHAALESSGGTKPLSSAFGNAIANGERLV